MLEQSINKQDVQKGCSARPQREKRRGVPLRYVEALNDARTPLAAFFNILQGYAGTRPPTTPILRNFWSR